MKTIMQEKTFSKPRTGVKGLPTGPKFRECSVSKEALIERERKWSTGSALDVLCLVAQSCHTLCDPMDCSPQAPLSMGILQARILEWAAMPSSRGSSQPRDRPGLPQCRILYHLSHQRSPQHLIVLIFTFFNNLYMASIFPFLFSPVWEHLRGQELLSYQSLMKKCLLTPRWLGN